MRKWCFFSEEWIELEQPSCYKCGHTAIGDYYNGDWEHRQLCSSCYNEENTR